MKKRKVLDIQLQKRRKNRRSIFLDDGSVFGVSDDVFLSTPIHVGDTISEKLLNEILDSESKTKINESVEETDSENSLATKENDNKLLNVSADKAIEQFRKLRENSDHELTEKEMEELDKQCKIIKEREIITQDTEHKTTEIISKDGTVITGPPTLTRFEKARIMGARALQLSLGAPVFIEIPKNATTSLEIAMEELEQRVIPIVIRRTLPNSDYQNIPIDKFQ